MFKLLVSVFAELGDTGNSLFSKRAKIVEIVAKLKCCVILLDIDCNDVVLDMFNTFFSVVRCVIITFTGIILVLQSKWLKQCFCFYVYQVISNGIKNYDLQFLLYAERIINRL